jgi:hypothetical protein
LGRKKQNGLGRSVNVLQRTAQPVDTDARAPLRLIDEYHSKSFRHHAVMTSLFAAWYNFCRKNQTLRSQTPAMAAGISDYVWSLEELLETSK